MLPVRSRLIVLSVLAALTAQPDPGLAQSATLLGTVMDRARQVQLEGAEVSLLGTSLRRITDARGRFQFDSVTPGTYGILVLRLGYRPDSTTRVALTAGQRTEITIRLGPPGPIDTCAGGRASRAGDWERARDFIQRGVREMSEYLGLPPLGRLDDGRSEIRYWNAWSLALDNHLLRITRMGDMVTGELFRWWVARNEDGLSELSVDWAEAHREFGRCNRLTLDATYYVCYIRLEPRDLRPFLDAVAETRHDLTAHGSLPPLDTSSCPRPGFVLDPPHTVLEIASAEAVTWYGLRSALGIWPNARVVHRLETAAWDVERRYWVSQPQ
jgi:Carboxypeptidase regulatory-like domain